MYPGHGLQHHGDPSRYRHPHQAGGAPATTKAIIVIEPRRIDLVRHATLWLRQRPGTDIAVINGLMNVIIQENLHDQAYIAERTENFDALKETVAKYTPEYVEQISGVPAADLRRAARLYGAGQGRRHRLCHGHHPAHHRHGQRQDPWPTWPCSAATSGIRRRRGQSPPGPEQRPGGLRHGRPAQRLFRLSAGNRCRTPRAKMEAAWGVKNLPDWVGLTMTEHAAGHPRGQN